MPYKREEIIRKSLSEFLSAHCAETFISGIDDIVLNYMVNILEELGQAAEETSYYGASAAANDSFDIDEFVAMMEAYLPGFQQFDVVEVSEWIFLLAAQLDQLKDLMMEDVVSSSEVTSSTDTELSKQDENPTSINNPNLKSQARAIPSFNSLASRLLSDNVPSGSNNDKAEPVVTPPADSELSSEVTNKCNLNDNIPATTIYPDVCQVQNDVKTSTSKCNGTPKFMNNNKSRDRLKNSDVRRNSCDDSSGKKHRAKQEDFVKCSRSDSARQKKPSCDRASFSEQRSLCADEFNLNGRHRASRTQSESDEKSLCLLREMFPGVTDNVLTECLSTSHHDLDDAVLLVLDKLERSPSDSAGCDSSEMTKERTLSEADQNSQVAVKKNGCIGADGDSQLLKKSIVARYSYVDIEEQNVCHRPTLLKQPEQKKMIRYLDNRVVSLKGEKFTEIKKPMDEEEKKTYINLKPARQYRFH